ncbi:MAG: hypothetical protein ACI30X_05865 [Muribaculaceae bacterium]
MKNNVASCNCSRLISYLNDARAQEILKKLDEGTYSKFFADRDRILERLFRASSNSDFDAVYLKCTVLNDFYSTRIPSDELAKIAKKIVKNHAQIDAWLAAGADDIIEAICSYGSRSNYSFATKYANWHNHLDFPIYDSFVHELLCCLRQCAMPDLFPSNKSLKKYGCLRAVLKKVVDQYNLTFCKDANGIDMINYKLLDKFLWALSNFVVFSTPKTEFIIGNYKIIGYKNGSVRIFEGDEIVENTLGTLREIANMVNFTFEESWNTRQFGHKLLDYLQKKSKK